MNCKKCNKSIPDDSKFCCYCGIKQFAERKSRTRGNGWGTVYKRENGKWQCELRNPRRTKGGFATKKEALDYLNKMRDGVKTKDTTTLQKLYNLWSESSLPKLSESKQTAYKIAYNRLPKVLLYKPIANITIQELQDAVQGLTYYPARDIRTLFSHLYKRACAQGDVSANLSSFIELPQNNEKEREAFTDEEIYKIWEHYSRTGSRVSGYTLLMIYSGMMPGELLNCKREMIDFEKGLIVGCGLKTKKRKETPIVLTDTIIPVVQHVCGKTKLVEMNKDIFYKAYYEELSKANVRQLPPYSCRHTTATALATKIPASILKEVMRHTKFSTTQRYIHLTQENVRSSLNLITNTLPTEPSKKP